MKKAGMQVKFVLSLVFSLALMLAWVSESFAASHTYTLRGEKRGCTSLVSAYVKDQRIVASGVNYSDTDLKIGIYDYTDGNVKIAESPTLYNKGSQRTIAAYGRKGHRYYACIWVDSWGNGDGQVSIHN